MKKTPSRQTKSATDLCAQFGVSFDSSTIYAALVRSGHMRIVPYLSTTGSGEEKNFRQLTESGLAFGRNAKTIHPFKTQPEFYPEEFPKLLQVVVAQLDREVASLKDAGGQSGASGT